MQQDVVAPDHGVVIADSIALDRHICVPQEALF